MVDGNSALHHARGGASDVRHFCSVLTLTYLHTTHLLIQHARSQAFWTTIATLCASGIEIALCHLWATGRLSMSHDLWSPTTLLWAITITHWRVPHFWVIHRSMHPWRVEGIPDVGKFLYRHVHSLHHKSYNPTAFSGTNMHPVESTLYYSAAFIPVFFGAHPAIALGCLVDCAVGAWLGHDGFQFPYVPYRLVIVSPFTHIHTQWKWRLLSSTSSCSL